MLGVQVLVHILQLDIADTDSLPKKVFLQSNPNLLPNNLARQLNRYNSIPMEAADEIFGG
jgi:hypothetical protein